MRLITKTQLASTLQCTPRTIQNYHQIAFAYIDDYENDYPVFAGEPLTSSRLTEYQTWLLRQLYLLGQRLASRKLIPQIIQSNSEQYTKEYYEQTTNNVNVAQLIQNI
ncbi:MAG: hypothetical protein HC815_30845 [Richelia sp. RM1_1_1]|nr:hypothetical protein [Richelia sp. RM1_1_1]